jgi:hypothetical protein
MNRYLQAEFYDYASLLRYGIVSVFTPITWIATDQLEYVQ